MKRRSIISLFLAFLLCTGSARSQGSIFGQAVKSDLGVPDDTELVFIGFLYETDDEIRLSSSDGAGYDLGNWYDDFQNYFNEAPGVPYDYFFFDTVSGEYHRLSKLVPSNSYQQEDIELAPVSFPAGPTGAAARALLDGQVRLTWDYETGLVYHVYRRPVSSQGSFFRIDDPEGDLSTTGISDSVFVDTTVGAADVYDYLIISWQVADTLPSPPVYVTVDPEACCEGMTGNIDGDPEEIVDIGDLTVLIIYLWIPPNAVPPCMGEANIDGDPEGKVDVGDLTELIKYLFIPPHPIPAFCP